MRDAKDKYIRLNPPIWQHDAYTLRRLQDAIEREIRELLKERCLIPESATVVDYGGGDVPYRSLFSSHCARYVACDLQKQKDIDLVFKENGSIPLPDASARCVVSFQVLEHVWDLDHYLGECRRLLEPDGCLLLSTHGTWLYHPHPCDYRRWTRDGLCKELEFRGFEVMRISSLIGPLAWTTQFRLFGLHHVLKRLGYFGRLGSAALSMISYVRMHLEDRLTPPHLRDTNGAIYVVVARPRS